MRVTSSPIPRLAAAGAPDHPAASGGEPFRAALRAAGTAGQPGNPTAPTEPDDHGDDTMAPAAAQAAYLARRGAVADPTKPVAPAADPAKPTRRATSADSLESAAAAVALSSLGVGGVPASPDPAPGGGPRSDSPVESNRTTSPPHLPEAALDPMTAAALRAAYGLAAETTPTGSVAHRQATAPTDESPVATFTAAAIGRAISALGAGGAIRATPVAAAGATPATTAAALPATALPATAGSAAIALTPLEQAVHDLVGRLGVTDAAPARGRAAKPADDDTGSGSSVLPGPGAPPVALARDAPGATATAAAPARGAPLAQPPEPPANPSHVHLVIDDGPERVVATVAVRGSEVHVTLRATDDATTAALARNAASLDHAMQGRGLDLGELTAEREPRDHARRQDPEPQERRNPDAEPFELEE